MAGQFSVYSTGVLTMPRITPIELLHYVDQPAFSIRKTVKLAELPTSIGSGFSLLAEYCRRKNVLPCEIPFVIFHDYLNSTEHQIDLDVVMPVKNAESNDPAINAIVLPQTKVICCIYQGSYVESGPVYVEMAEWAKSKGLTIVGDCYECYYNGVEYDESLLLTKITIPVA
jgi:effector-binding domain-containing protein